MPMKRNDINLRKSLFKLFGKKGQIQQVFIYITVVLVIGFLVIFGFRMVHNLLDQQCDVQQQQFISAFKDSIDSGTRWGSKTKSNLIAACDFEQLCLVDSSLVGESTFLHPNEVIRYSVRDGIKFNVFVTDAKGTTIPLLYDERIKSDDDSICLDAQSGRFHFWLEGLGKEGAKVSNGDALNPNGGGIGNVN